MDKKRDDLEITPHLWEVVFISVERRMNGRSTDDERRMSAGRTSTYTAMGIREKSGLSINPDFNSEKGDCKSEICLIAQGVRQRLPTRLSLDRTTNYVLPCHFIKINSPRGPSFGVSRIARPLCTADPAIRFSRFHASLHISSS